MPAGSINNTIKIRQATGEDASSIAKLYSETVRNINSRDYSAEQIEAWAKSGENENLWKQKIMEQYFVVAEIGNEIAGIASVDKTGYLDYMYVHKDYQRQGIASGLLKEIEAKAIEQKNKAIYSSVSKTARPFFEKSGYLYVGDDVNYAGEIEFVNSIMKKCF